MTGSPNLRAIDAAGDDGRECWSVGVMLNGTKDIVKLRCADGSSMARTQAVQITFSAIGISILHHSITPLFQVLDEKLHHAVAIE
jgi:hypothetical protein